MNSQLPPEIREETDALCRKISVAHNLDAEIQEELRGHIEDKVLAYLNGEEAVTPADAMLLAREHFGDARTLKGLLREVHAPEVHATFARRLLAIVVVSLLVFWVYSPLSGFLIACGVRSAANGASGIPFQLAHAILEAIPLLCTGMILLRYHRQIRQGLSPWFVRLTPASLMVWTFAILFLTMFLVPSVQTNITMSTHFIEQIAPFLSNLYRILNLTFGMATAALWIWWLDRSPRRLTTMALAILAYVAYRPLMNAFILLGWHVRPEFLLDSGSNWSFQIAPVFRMDWFWSFRGTFAPLYDMSVFSVRSALPSVGIAVVLYAVWAALRKCRDTTNLPGIDQE